MRRNKEKTHCKRGHPFAGENLYVDPQGKRHCQICERGYMRLRAGWPEELAFTLPPQKLGYRPNGIGNKWEASRTTKQPKPTPIERFLKFVKIQPGCWIWAGPVNETGYGRFFYNGKNRKAPRVAYELMVGPIPPSDYSVHGTMIMHTCDNPKCVNPLHLRLGNAADNMADAKAKGRLHGNGRNRLNAIQVQEIRIRAASGELHKSIAADFGIDVAHVSHIKLRKIWKSVP